MARQWQAMDPGARFEYKSRPMFLRTTLCPMSISNKGYPLSPKEH